MGRDGLTVGFTGVWRKGRHEADRRQRVLSVDCVLGLKRGCGVSGSDPCVPGLLTWP